MPPPTLVLVDDLIDKRLLLERFLKKRFPQNPVVSFPDCASATAMVEAAVPKVVVTNGRIGSKDGIAFAAYLQRELHIPVVIISYRANLEKSAHDAGVVAFLDPSDETGITEAVERALSQVAG